MPPTESQVEIDGVTINYVKSGNGACNVLCVPGMLGSWQPDFGKHVDEMTQSQFTLVAFDPAGYGKSRPYEREFSTETSRIDAEFGYKLMKKLGLLPFNVIGYSEGGRTALALAYDEPEQVGRVILIGCAPFVTPELYKYFLRTADYGDLNETTLAMLQETYDDTTLSQLWLKQREFYIETFLNGGDICLELLPGIKQEVLIIQGGKDDVLEYDRPAQRLQADLPRARTIIHPEANHDVHNEFPYWFRKVAEAFLTGGDVEAFAFRGRGRIAKFWGGNDAYRPQVNLMEGYN